jgi:hypothetical protein
MHLRHDKGADLDSIPSTSKKISIWKPMIKQTFKTAAPTVQWAPLNGITDNVINVLIGLNFSYLTIPKLTFPTYCMFISFAY